MKNKAIIWAQQTLMVVSSFGCLVSILILPPQSPVRLWSIIGLGLASIWQIFNTRCPHCGRLGGVKPKLLAKDAGVCVHCGKLVEYK